MKMGDIVLFPKTGKVGTIYSVETAQGMDYMVVSVYVHNWTTPYGNNPTIFRLQHLKQHAEVISEHRRSR